MIHGAVNRCACALALVLTGGVVSCSGGADLLIRNVQVVDVTGGGTYRASLCIADGRIRSIERAPGGGCHAERVIEGEGRYAIPGLWDMHVHLAEDGTHAEALDALLAHGITSARDMGGRFEVLDSWRRDIREGHRIGPDLLLVGPTINGPGDDSYHLEAATFEEGLAAADSVANLGADQVKVHRLLPRDAFRGVIAGAERHGLRVVGHIPRGTSSRQACELGMDEFAHLSAVLEAAVMREEEAAAGLASAVAELTGENGQAVYDCMAARQGALTPNLVAYAHIARTADSVAAALTWRLIGALGPVVRRSAASGVMLMVGSDAPGENLEIPWGVSVHEELELLVRAGLSPGEALAAATVAPARFTGTFADVGSIDEGKRADLLLLRSNPLVDISATREIEWVIARGRRYPPAMTASGLRGGAR